MGLAETLRADFRPGIRERGSHYYQRGLVRIESGSAIHVDATVHGSTNYDVTLDLKNGALHAGCDCPFFSSEGPCKHLWATILKAEAMGYLASVPPGLQLIEDQGGEEDIADEPPDDHGRFRLRAAAAPRRSEPPMPSWRAQINGFTQSLLVTPPPSIWPAKREVAYVVDVPASLNEGTLVLIVGARHRKANGEWTRVSGLGLKLEELARLPVAEDREIVSLLAGNIRDSYSYAYGPPGYASAPTTYRLLYPLSVQIISRAARSGRCYLRSTMNSDDLSPLAWDDGGPWAFRLQLRPHEPEGWELRGVLRRGEECLDLAAPALILEGGLVFTAGKVAPLAENAQFQWILFLRKQGVIVAPDKDRDRLLETLLNSPGLPPLEVPEQLRFEEVTVPPRPQLRVRAGSSYDERRLMAELSFDYGGRLISAQHKAGGLYDSVKRRLLHRDPAAEEAARELLNSLGLRFRPWNYMDLKSHWELTASKLPRVTRTLVEAGWHVEADGKLFRRPGGFRLEIATGVDWFELHGVAEYGDTQAKLPELLAALRRGDGVVRLGDGSYGMLPEEWLQKIGMLAGLGAHAGDHIRFRRSQAGFLDALLAAAPEATCDETFNHVRQELRDFQGVEAAAQPPGFAGQLRGYQREGLGWMEFLRRFSFGGCLADDMGVGKTAQVLALLEARRALRAAGERIAPSLVVVPRSLVFNWKEEAARFTPQLRVLDYTGVGRNGDDFAAYDLVLSTYGTLRRDAARLKDVDFDYVILDEAQAIKNSATASAKAARLLRGAHRLALSGTPVENHLGELWSLFEFLNPGMLGAASVFKLAGTAARTPDDDTRRLLAHALRPFILRRTKQQVARELPEKTEQTLHCELKPEQRALYNELREHYRRALLKKIEAEGLAKSKIQVLEALLRLRQAACHPGLLDPKRRGEPSAKLESLLAQLSEVIDEGHKALVFSQFTSLLAIVRDRLDSNQVVYEYLDGATRDRQARVERFQNDPDCRLFLISLKAGGLGLNLTAAEYVFLLDPWWNPAVEAQATDRAHRIGQTHQVFAYRLIARDTVEEKVLELQKTKRDLADAIIGADNSLIRDLKREDLELLLS
ncbi:MAG TPA: SNF2-related protein [Terriglobia bacterium]|nr:SNF2-related protein [Terriglobia bacterium]